VLGIAVIAAACWAAEPRAVAAAIMQAGTASRLVIVARATALTLAGSAWWL
jgi:hypothetical protein